MNERVHAPARLLALQCAGTQSWGGYAGRATGPIEMDSALASGVAAGMPEVWWLACVWTYKLDRSVDAVLYARLSERSHALAERERWGADSRVRARIPSLVRLALEEQFTPARFRYDVIRAASAGMTVRQWHRAWAGRYEAVYRILDDWGHQGLRFMADAQRGQ